MDLENDSSNDTQYLLEYSLDTDSSAFYLENSTVSLLNKSVEEIMKNESLNDFSTNFQEHASFEKINNFKDIESMILSQDSKLIELHAKLYSLFAKPDENDMNKAILGALGLKPLEMLHFIKIFENYCYFIRLYEYQLYCTNNDKYIKFLIDTILDSDLKNEPALLNYKRLKHVVFTFTNTPSNIYMKLSWILYHKDFQKTFEMLKTWKIMSDIKLNLKKLSNIWDEKIQRKTLNIIIKKYNSKVADLNVRSDMFLHNKIRQIVFIKWMNKISLLQNYNIFGKELVKERTTKLFLKKKLSALNLLDKRACDYRRTHLKKVFFSKVSKRLNRLNKNNATATIYINNKLKYKFVAQMKKISALLINLSIISNTFIIKKTFQKILSIAKDRLSADKFYFYTLKKTYMAHFFLLFKLKTFTATKNVGLKTQIVNKWLEALTRQISMNVLAEEHFENRVEYEGNNLLFKKILAKQTYLNQLNDLYDNHKVRLNKLLLKKCLQEWCKMSHNIKINKLDYLAALHLEAKSTLRAKEVVLGALQNALSDNTALIIYADDFYRGVLKKRVIKFLEKRRETALTQILIAEKYKEKRAVIKSFAQLKNKYNFTMDINQLSSVYADRKLYKIIKLVITNWNLKLLKVNNMSTSLDTHLKRWKRAELRGILSLWLNQMHESQYYRSSIYESKINGVNSLKANKNFLKNISSANLSGFDNADVDIAFETPAKKAKNRMDALDYLNFKNLQIQERKRFYQGSMKKPIKNAAETILKPSPIKTSKTLSKTMKQKLDLTDSSFDYESNNVESNELDNKTFNRNDILNKYRLDEYNSIPDKSLSSIQRKKFGNLKENHTKPNFFPNNNNSTMVFTSSPIKNGNYKFGNIPNLSKPSDFIDNLS